jgi:translation initiation factor 2 subunit 1
MTDDWKNSLLHVIRQRLMPKPVKIRCDFELMCYSADGIEAIKASLRAGEACSTDRC